jgi:hypothetical protein
MPAAWTLVVSPLSVAVEVGGGRLLLGIIRGVVERAVVTEHAVGGGLVRLGPLSNEVALETVIVSFGRPRCSACSR